MNTHIHEQIIFVMWAVDTGEGYMEVKFVMLTNQISSCVKIKLSFDANFFHLYFIPKFQELCGFRRPSNASLNNTFISILILYYYTSH